MRFRKLVALGGLSVVLLLATSRPSAGQKHEPALEDTTAEHEETEHKLHPNHFGGLIGVSTHHDIDDSGFTLGLEYARVFSSRWAIAAYLELVSSVLERDVVFAVGGIFYPIRGLSLVLAPGVEQVEKDVEVHGAVEKETELEFLLRFGVGYAFRLTPAAAIGPAVFVDRTRDRWTSLVSIGMFVGF